MASFLGLKVASLILTYVVILVEGRIDMTNLLTEEESNIQRILGILNKTPIKSMHALWGDIYDCIEFWEQPAFDHPLLKDHKVEIKEDYVSTNYLKTPLNHVDECPKGTVPIRRTKKEDLIKVKLASNAPDIQYRAGVMYQTKPGETIYGASGTLNVWNPQVNKDQFSSAEIVLQSGSGEQFTVIKYGWTVDPVLYGDYVTRSFSYWTVDNGNITGCYNTLCPGFVQVHPKYTPDMPFTKTSEIGGEQIYFTAEITLDNMEGKWWLTINGNVQIGYWPKILFPALAPGATSVFWGGRVKSGIDGMSPPMCSGHPISRRIADACFIDSFKYVDTNNFYHLPGEYQYAIDCKEHYNAKCYNGQNIIHFGGSGGANCR